MSELYKKTIEDLTDKLPINPENIESKLEGYSILKLKDGKGFTKRYSDYDHGKPLLEANYGNQQWKVDAAEGNRKYIEIAKIFQKFAKKKFYHPKTQFIVCEGKDRKPTIMAIIPELKPIDTINSIFLPQKKLMEKEKLIKKFKLDHLHGDSCLPFNYGKAEDGEVYYFDLHLFV